MSAEWGSLLRRAAHKPSRQLLQIAARALAERVGAAELDTPLDDHDVWDSAREVRPASAVRGDGPRRIGWVVVPPTPGSGGHTTLFRMVAAAARAGHHNTLLFSDRFHGDFATNVARVRRGWPWLECEIRDIDDGVADLDVLVASAWQTAHVMLARSAHLAVDRFVFMQDYEPDFLPNGSLRALAEDSYRFAATTRLALGPMVASRLRHELGLDSVVVPYGTDRTTYRLTGDAPREGVVFFAKVHNDRRGYRMGVLALREFQHLAPHVPIHVYGDRMRESGLHVEQHGYLRPDQLNALYNRVKAGLVLSFTNVSLVPAELAAAGAVPVVNEWGAAREVLDNPHVRWARATPSSLAHELLAATRLPDGEAPARAAWPTASWDDTARAVLEALTHRTHAGRASP